VDHCSSWLNRSPCRYLLLRLSTTQRHCMPHTLRSSPAVRRLRDQEGLPPVVPPAAAPPAPPEEPPAMSPSDIAARKRDFDRYMSHFRKHGYSTHYIAVFCGLCEERPHVSICDISDAISRDPKLMNRRPWDPNEKPNSPQWGRIFWEGMCYEVSELIRFIRSRG
jgi:hypothetical protein